MPWRSWINAEIYDRFVRERQIYEWLNRRLVGLAEIETARRILDLGCGTGATTHACLPRMRADAEIVGIDASAEMIGVARSNLIDPRARFEVLAAAEADRLEGRFDRIVCNAAFWQFPSPRAAFAALEAVASVDARMVFNVPAERVKGESSPVHPFQVALLRQIEIETGRPFEAMPILVEDSVLDAAAGEHGFERIGTERFVYEGKQDELTELMSIPAMIVPLTAELSPAQRDAALRRATEQTDPGQPVSVPWIYFTFRRRPAR